MRRALLAAFGGVAIGLGGAPTELSLVTMLAPAAFLLAVEPSPGAAVSLRASLWLGLLTGGVANLYSMYWVVELLMEFGSFPLVAALPTGALLWVGPPSRRGRRESRRESRRASPEDRRITSCCSASTTASSSPTQPTTAAPFRAM